MQEYVLEAPGHSYFEYIKYHEDKQDMESD